MEKKTKRIFRSNNAFDPNIILSTLFRWRGTLKQKNHQKLKLKLKDVLQSVNYVNLCGF